MRRPLNLTSIVVPTGIAAGLVTWGLHPPQDWIERSYVNGSYAIWQHTISAVTLRLPFALDDALKCILFLVAVAIVFAGWRRAVLTASISEGPPSEMPARIRRHIFVFFLTIAELLAVGGYITAWFFLSWGWNYNRAPVQARVQYDAASVNPQTLARLREKTMREMNALAPLAHSRIAAAKDESVDVPALQTVWLPVVQRMGDTWTPNVGPPKSTLVDPVMDANGTSGFISPFTLEVLSASDLLWFERPFDLAHEWTHVAGFAREDEANYAASLACIRSRDPVIAYSGWFEIFLYLPPLTKYHRSMFVPQVWQDFAALRARNARYINVAFEHFSWGAYNAYLKSNRISSGINSYNEVTRLLLGIPLDPDGLPEKLPGT